MPDYSYPHGVSITPGAKPADVLAALKRKRRPHMSAIKPDTAAKAEVERLTGENKRLTKQYQDARAELQKAQARIKELEATIESQGRAGAAVAGKAAASKKGKAKLTEAEILAQADQQPAQTTTPPAPTTPTA